VVARSHAQGNAPDNKNSSAGVISGKVSTRDGEVMPNARVSVGRASGGSSSQVLRVDNNGHFETQPLEPGLYFISVFAPGYTTDTNQPSTLPPYYRPGDISSFTLIKGGVITGTVKNGNGDAIVAIPVRAIRVKDKEGKQLQFSSSYRDGLTDDRGVYRLYGLPAGTYLVSAGGPSRPGFSPAGPSAYETYVPTYAPSATRDTAMEIPLNNGDEVTADVQFREERGHVISGAIAGATKYEVGSQSWGVGISLFDLRSHADVANASANSTNNFAFALYGVPDGEYELYASQGSASGNAIASSAKQIKVQGADITGISVALALAASIEGRVVFENDPKAACGKRRASTMLETLVYARRYESARTAKDAATGDVPYVFRNSLRQAIPDAKGIFTVKNLQPGTYRIDPREPASGWYVKSITVGPAARPVSVARDGVTIKSGEPASGITIAIAEGASQLRGRITVGEGQSLSSDVRLYLVPFEREAAENVLRFYEARPETNGKFTVDNINPGKYFIIAKAAEQNEYGIAKSIRFDAAFRAKVLQDTQALKREIALKPCEQTFDYELPLTAPTSP
ncbi:MAG: hypothetical protein DMF73_00680, partial [Acidobacteria bacterium]